MLIKNIYNYLHKKYYKYILHYNLLVLDMYDNTYDYYNKDKETTDKQIQIDISYY
jgi:hypothetical protein